MEGFRNYKIIYGSRQCCKFGQETRFPTFGTKTKWTWFAASRHNQWQLLRNEWSSIFVQFIIFLYISLNIFRPIGNLPSITLNIMFIFSNKKIKWTIILWTPYRPVLRIRIWIRSDPNLFAGSGSDQIVRIRIRP